MIVRLGVSGNTADILCSRFGRFQIVQPYSSTDTTIPGNNPRFISSVGSDFYKVVNLSIAVLASPMCVLKLI